MTLTATSSATGASASASALSALTSATGSSADSAQSFLTLLVTQLNNQDPLNPLDNAQLTSQLAQLSTVSGIEQLNTAVQSLVTQSGSSQALQSASLIGHTVLAPGDGVTLSGGAAVPFSINMPQAADAVKVTITDAAGNTVRSYDLGALPQGVTNLGWDGTADSGSPAPDGAYKVSVTASQAGASVAATALTYAQVVSVAQGASGVTLDLGVGRTANLSDVKQIL